MPISTAASLVDHIVVIVQQENLDLKNLNIRGNNQEALC